MALSDDRIAEMMRDTWGCSSIAPRHAAPFARAVEAEVRKQDEALIRQLVEALEQSQPYVESCANGKRVQGWGEQLDRAQDAINAARSRLEQPCA